MLTGCAVCAGGRDRLRQGHGFPSGPGVAGAAEPAVAAHPPRAFLVAGQAGADRGRVLAPGLGREVRVGDLPADHPHQVTLAGSQHLLSLLRAGDPARPDDRDAHRGPDRRRDVHGVTGTRPHARHDPVQGGGGHPDRGVDVVHGAGGVGEPGHLDGLAERGAALDHLVTADPHAEHAPRADRRADRGHDLEQQTGAVGQ